jgi:hypothetical protein
MPAASPGQAAYRKDFVPALITNLPVANTAAPTWRIRSANRKNHSDRTFSMTQRKLAAILSADAEAYSRLMGADDALTVKTITRSRAIFAACVDNLGGRVVYTPGDAVLAEFPSAVDAVELAPWKFRSGLRLPMIRFQQRAGCVFASASTWGKSSKKDNNEPTDGHDKPAMEKTGQTKPERVGMDNRRRACLYSTQRSPTSKKPDKDIKARSIAWNYI